MTTPDIEKKKRRKRSARVYLSNAHPLPSPEQLAALVDQFPSDEDDDGQPASAKPKAKARKRGAEKANTGNPVDRPDGRSWTESRVSPSRVQGNASPAVDDHGVGYQPGPRELAYRHPDMRQGTTNPMPLLGMRTDANPHPRDLSGAAGVTIALSRLDAAGAAGMPDFSAMPSGNPAMHGADHIAPVNATGPSAGGHPLNQPEARHPMSMKASDRVDIMRQAMFPGHGAR